MSPSFHYPPRFSTAAIREHLWAAPVYQETSSSRHTYHQVSENAENFPAFSMGWLFTHACLSLSALKSLIGRLETVINSQQVPLAPLTKSGVRTWSALLIPPVLYHLRWTWQDVWLLWKAKCNFSFMCLRGKEQPKKHFTLCSHFSKNY